MVQITTNLQTHQLSHLPPCRTAGHRICPLHRSVKTLPQSIMSPLTKCNRKATTHLALASRPSSKPLVPEVHGAWQGFRKRPDLHGLHLDNAGSLGTLQAPARRAQPAGNQQLRILLQMPWRISFPNYHEFDSQVFVPSDGPPARILNTH